MKPAPKDITFHYTNEQMVRDLIAITPLSGTVLDAGSGKNKVWYNNLDNFVRYECEIEDGVDFMEWKGKVNWVIGNPPFHESWKFTEKALEVATDGIAFLHNNTGLNSLFTPRRQQIIRDAGFYLQKIHIVSDKRWFGRYYYVIYSKQISNILSWERKTY